MFDTENNERPVLLWVVVGVIFIIGVVVLSVRANTEDRLAQRQAQLLAEIEALEHRVATTLADDDAGFDTEAYLEELDERTVSAKAIAEEIIEVDDFLTGLYKRNSVMDDLTDEERQANVERTKEMQARNTALRGETDHLSTWQLNPDWTLELASVVAYQETSHIPVVFKMTTSSGELAGFIRATYHVDEHKITDVIKHYTAQGFQDQASLGGY